LRQMRNTLWRPMVPELREREAAMREKKAAEPTTAGGGVSELEETSRRLQLQPRGRVVRIMEAKAVGSLVGGLQLQNMDVCKPGEKLPDSVQGLYFQPLDTKYPNLYVFCSTLFLSFLVCVLHLVLLACTLGHHMTSNHHSHPTIDTILTLLITWQVRAS
jgi:hypothetical protein